MVLPEQARDGEHKGLEFEPPEAAVTQTGEPISLRNVPDSAEDVAGTGDVIGMLQLLTEAGSQGDLTVETVEHEAVLPASPEDVEVRVGQITFRLKKLGDNLGVLYVYLGKGWKLDDSRHAGGAIRELKDQVGFGEVAVIHNIVLFVKESHNDSIQPSLITNARNYLVSQQGKFEANGYFLVAKPPLFWEKTLIVLGKLTGSRKFVAVTSRDPETTPEVMADYFEQILARPDFETTIAPLVSKYGTSIPFLELSAVFNKGKI